MFSGLLLIALPWPPSRGCSARRGGSMAGRRPRTQARSIRARSDGRSIGRCGMSLRCGLIGARGLMAEVVNLAQPRVGRDEDEIRSWTGWPRQMTPALLARAAPVLGVANGGPSPRPRGRLPGPRLRPGAPAPP